MYQKCSRLLGQLCGCLSARLLVTVVHVVELFSTQMSANECDVMRCAAEAYVLTAQMQPLLSTINVCKSNETLKTTKQERLIEVQ